MVSKKTKFRYKKFRKIAGMKLLKIRELLVGMNCG